MRFHRAVEILRKHAVSDDYGFNDYESEIATLEKRIKELKARMAQREMLNADLNAAIRCLESSA